jgi:exosortase
VLLFQFLGNSVFGYIDTGSLFGWMYEVYDTSPDDEHGKLIPFAVLGLFWWKREELMRLPKGIWWPALTLVVLALAFHVVGYIVQQTRVSIVAFFLGLYGLMGLVWGRQVLVASFFPMVLFVFCIPLATMSESITFPLRILVTKISAWIANNALGIGVIREGSQIMDQMRTFQYDVAAACSGIRSLISLLALTTIYGFITFSGWGKRLFMVLLAFPLAVAGNVVRITGVIVTGEAFGQDAGAYIEQKFGFVTFAVAIACVLAIGYWLREVEPPAQKPA